MSGLVKYSEIFNKEFEKYYVPPVPAGLYEPVSYTLSIGGKRIRPLLCLMSCDLCGGDITKALPAAVAVELFHNFTLIHDDIMDVAPIRRGKPTVFNRWGSNAGILSGDAMFAMAFEELAKSASENVGKLTSVLARTAIEVCEGQQLDMDFENMQSVAEDEYIEMIRLKTSVLIAASLKLGAIVAGAGEKTLSEFYTYGEKLGLAFQIQDDWLDTFGDERVFGKKTGGDIIAGKKTYLFVRAYKDADAKLRSKLNETYSSKDIISEEKIRIVKELFEALNIKEKVKDKMNMFFDDAVSVLSPMQISAEAKLFLSDFANKLVNREV